MSNETVSLQINEESLPVSFPQRKDLTDQQRRDLTKLRDRLLNLSSRNRSIRLNRLDAKWTFDLSLLNPFGSEVANELLQHCLTSNTPKSILPKPKEADTLEIHQKLSTRITHLHRSITEIQREKGLHDLYIGFPFVAGIPAGSDTVVQAPVFLLPVKLDKIMPNKGASNWVLTATKEMPVIFNKTLFLALSKMCNLAINPSLFEEEIPSELYGAASFVEKAHQLLNDYGIQCEIAPEAQDKEIDPVFEFTIKDLPEFFQPGKLKVCQYAVLGHFPQSNSSIQRDYDRFLELDQEELESIICFLTPEHLLSEEKSNFGDTPLNTSFEESNFSDDLSAKTIDDRSETENFVLLPSDSSQDRIILELGNTKKTGIVIWGPPGTGKSQTIVNLIGDCLAREKSVLLVSQKRAALDVVYERLETKNLTNLVGLVHDSKSDRKPLYEKISQQTSQVADLNGRPITAPIDPSSEIERIGQTLKEVFQAYNDCTFGLKLGEVYRKLGGNKTTSIEVDSVFWKTKNHEDLSKYNLQLRSFQKHIQIESDAYLIKKRRSFSQIANQDVASIKECLAELISDRDLLEANAIIALKDGKPLSELDLISFSKLKEFEASFAQYQAFKGGLKYLKPLFWKSRSKVMKELHHARSQAQKYAKMAGKVLLKIFEPPVVQEIIQAVLNSKQDRTALNEFSEVFSKYFYEIKSHDIALEALAPELRPIVDAIQNNIREEKLSPSDDWGNIFERSVYAVWISELEQRHPVVTLLRSGQIDSLREQYKDLLRSKVDYCVYSLKKKLMNGLETPEGFKFKREISADVSKTRNIFSIRKLNEKFIDRNFYRSLLPIWLVSPEVVSDVFPLKKELFDVVIFDEASQCTVEQGLPAIYRGKQIIIAGDEKQLPPSKAFESTIEEDHTDEDAHATDEPSLLTLAKKTLLYKSHMLEWHYRSKHQELITFSNEVFYGGRMKIAPNVIPFKRGNKPAIAWHKVDGYWEDNTNRTEANKVIERIRHFLSQDKSPTLGIITFNAPQKELILDLIDERRLSDPEFDRMIQEDRQRPIDSQLFVKNIENVQGDEREVIIFSVAYARSEPTGRVNHQFGTLNNRGGENRLNVAITRAINQIEIIASIEPEQDLNVSSSINAGPKILKNYLCFAKAVANEDFDRVEALLNEINPNLKLSQNRGGNLIESPFEAEVLIELEKVGYRVHTQVGQSGFRIDMAVVHPNDPSRYLLGIECDGAIFHSGISIRERDVFRQNFLEKRGWTIHRIWSTNWWDNKEKEIQKIQHTIESLLRKSA